MKTYKFSESHFTGGHAEVVISEKQIIEYVRRDEWNSEMEDDEAVDHFVAIHWAYCISDKEERNHPAGIPWGIVAQWE